jgi:hypothetical protein
MRCPALILVSAAIEPAELVVEGSLESQVEMPLTRLEARRESNVATLRRRVEFDRAGVCLAGEVREARGPDLQFCAVADKGLCRFEDRKGDDRGAGKSRSTEIRFKPNLITFGQRVAWEPVRIGRFV